MLKIPLCGMAIACLLIFVPVAPAMQSSTFHSQRDIDQSNNSGFENLCAPDFYGEVNEEPMPIALNFQQIESVRIQLLENGFEPGFDPARDAAIDPQLREAVVQFQSEYRLPVTGQIDATTLEALNVPIQRSKSAVGREAAQLGKPSE
jgi:peptidoglycan hydrolase-like protein with peptidoglycan-binding domain